MNKPWKKPELVVLIRSKPEESVLTACKTTLGSGASDADMGCFVAISPCADCDTQNPS